LLHAFCGCETEAILRALDLAISDLFEKPLGHRIPPSRSSIPARDLLEVIDEEAVVVSIMASELLAGRQFDDSDWHRLAQAAARIGKARDHAHGR
jgi:hypothetical protein